jgi:predicted regulator of Ras-like GTPase activity (Roadblock/LC7/MglB family)
MDTEKIVRSVAVTLSSLRDIQGVHGSFFISPAGRLVSKDLPVVFDDALFAEVAPRLTRLHETLCSAGDDVEMCLLRYAEHKLFVRLTLTGQLCVLMASSVNLPALKMAVNLAARRINAELTGVGELPSAVSTPPPERNLAPAANRQIYRGSIVK